MDPKKEIYEEIKIKLSEIDLLIKGEQVDNDKISNAFKSIKKLIDEIDESEDENFYNTLKYKYHSNRANYFKFIGNDSAAKKEITLAEKYKKEIKSNVNFSQETSDVTVEPVSYESSSDELKETEENTFKRLNESFEKDDKALKNISDLIKLFQELNKTPNSIQQYFEFPGMQTNGLLTELEAKNIEILNEEEQVGVNELLLALKGLYIVKKYNRKIRFMEYMVRLDLDSKSLLYEVETKECVETISKK